MANNFFKTDKVKDENVTTPAVVHSEDIGEGNKLIKIKGEGVAKSTFVVPPVVNPGAEVDDEWKVQLTDYQQQVAKLVLIRGIEISESEYSVLSECEDKTQFVGFLSYMFNKKEYEHLNQDFEKVDILNAAKNPLMVGVNDIEDMLGYKSVEDIKKETSVVSKKVKADIEKQETDKYIISRNRRNKDGSLDRMLNINEIGIIERNVKKIFDNQAEAHVGMHNNDRLGGVVMALNDMSLDAKRTYEITKMHYCNTWGLTPESVDEFLVHMIRDRNDWLTENGVDNRKDIGRGSEFNETMKENILRYCKKVPGWEPGQIVYKSEFVEKLDAKENEILAKAYKKSRSDENKELIRSMGELWDPKKLQPRKRGIVKDAEKKADNFLERRKRKQVTLDNISEIDSPKEEVVHEEQKVHVGETKKETPKERSVPASARYAKVDQQPEHQKEMIEEPIKEELKVEIKEEVKPKGGTLKLKEGLTLEENIEYLAIVKKYTDMGLAQDQAIMLTDKEWEDRVITTPEPVKVVEPTYTEEEVSYSDESPVVDDTLESSPEPPKADLTASENKPGQIVDDWLKRSNKTNLDDYTKKYHREPDISILNNTSDRATKIKLYRESKKNGRIYYLVNSNYEVMVNKIYDRNQISFILQLLQNGAIRDVNLIDSFIKKELLQIVYKCIEFNFDVQPTYQDFVQCLSEADLTGLMMMIAIVNIPEDKEGRIPLTIQSVQCTNPECRAVGLLKEPIKIDLKDEFTRIYDIDAFSIKYNVYKSKTFKTIQDAYYDTNESVLKTFRDDIFEYEIGLSAPTVWKTQIIKDNSDSTSYRRLADSMSDKRDFITRDYDVDEVIDYLNTHSYQDFRYRAVAIQDTLEELGESGLTEKDRDELKLLGFIGVELNKVISADAIFNVLIDVVDYITIKDSETGEVVSEYVTLEDHYDILDMVTQGPTEMMESIVQAKQKYIDSTVATDLEFDSEELAGRFDFDSQYKSEEEFIEDIKAKNKHMSQETLDRYIAKQVEYRSESKDKYDKNAECICGSHKWKLNYTNILFFWAYNR